MTSRPRSGWVFVSYARADRARVKVLVDLMVRAQLSVFWDDDVEPGTEYRVVLEEALARAACVVVFWTKASVKSQWVRDEVARACQRCVLIPVMLDADITIPVGFGELQHLALHDWDGTDTADTAKLLAAIRKLTERDSAAISHEPPLTEHWIVRDFSNATERLKQLTLRLRSLGETLASGSATARDLQGVLAEVRCTYDAVGTAISRFVSPLLEPGPLDPTPYLEMERGTLITDIENGRGHCSRISTLYFRYQGLRDSIKDGGDPGLLAELDATFGQLSTADGDLFGSLTSIGEVLTEESRAIVNLLIEEQDAAARHRIIEGRRALAPLEASLQGAMRALQQIQASLGYAAPRAEAQSALKRSRPDVGAGR